MRNPKQLRLKCPTLLMSTIVGSDSESSPSPSPSPGSRATSNPTNFKLSSASVNALDLEATMMMKSARHQNRVKKGAMPLAIKLIYKYRARSISELFDKCTSDEYAGLIYTGEDYNKCVISALELFVKDSLEIQRRDRWEYMMSHAAYNETEEKEILRLFLSQNINPVGFAHALKTVFMCEHPKINSIKLYGTPNSGKSLIAQLIVKCFITCYANNHGSENEFFLSNFLNKAIILCEELFVTHATAEDFKSILSGANIDISKKFQEKQMLSRTPIIITSNFYDFGRGHLPHVDEYALKSRCFMFEFTRQFTPTCMITAPSMYHFLWLCLNQSMF